MIYIPDPIMVGLWDYYVLVPRQAMKWNLSKSWRFRGARAMKAFFGLTWVSSLLISEDFEVRGYRSREVQKLSWAFILHTNK